MDINYNVAENTDGKTVRAENSTFTFEYVSEGGVCLFALTSSFLWTPSFWQCELKEISKPEHGKPTSGVLFFHKNKVLKV